eukprot:250502-Chlamydomonas_euryale.AAC.5
MPVLSEAIQRGSSSGLGAVTKGTPLRTVLSHPIPTPPTGTCEPGAEMPSSFPPRGAWPADHPPSRTSPFSTSPSKQQVLHHRLIRHPGHVSQACDALC